MRSTLFFIPHELAGIPLFGFGWALGLLVATLLGYLVWAKRSGLAAAERNASLPVFGIAAVIIVFVLPNVEARWANGMPIGLPIRGYGVMVLLGLIAGIFITVRRAKRLGIDADTIVGLGFWMMLIGVVGARLFYVIQKWSTFDSLSDVFRFTEGGLVIYGGVLGGLVAGLGFCWFRGLNLLSMADLITPGFLIGQSLGRIGCLLHGCCFGGVCEASLPAIQFPRGSGPYAAQLETGRLLGLQLSSATLPTRIEAVRPESPAFASGIRAGQTLQRMQSFRITMEPGSDPTAAEPLLAELQVDGRSLTLPPAKLPERSLPTHPSQIYSAINACLLCLLTWHLQPLTRRDGVVFLVGIILYGTSRFMIEGIRSDEAGQLGTSFTVAQLGSILGVSLAVVGLLIILSRRAVRAWDWTA